VHAAGLLAWVRACPGLCFGLRRSLPVRYRQRQNAAICPAWC